MVKTGTAPPCTAAEATFSCLSHAPAFSWGLIRRPELVPAAALHTQGLWLAMLFEVRAQAGALGVFSQPFPRLKRLAPEGRARLLWFTGF